MLLVSFQETTLDTLYIPSLGDFLQWHFREVHIWANYPILKYVL